MSDVWCLRDLRPADVPAVFDGLSPHSRYLRFHAPVPRLTASMRAMLSDVRRGFAMVAVDKSHPPGRPVGIVRLVPLGDGRGELAVEVIDAAHRRGVATALLRAAMEWAATARIEVIEGSVLRANGPMLALLKRLFRDVSYAYDGPAVQVYIPAPSGR
jgi:RimJ/RimL family protein N-acetyltransferase